MSEEASVARVFLIERAEHSAPATPVHLTAREGEVLAWVAHGKTNRDIADILGMSPRTVNKHLEHIFEKLGVERELPQPVWRSGWASIGPAGATDPGAQPPRPGPGPPNGPDRRELGA